MKLRLKLTLLKLQFFVGEIESITPILGNPISI